MDITNFMTWFVQQFVILLSQLLTLLDSITFAGTSLLRVCLGITILGAALPIVLTIAKTVGTNGARSITERRKNDNESR